jgi:phytoene dehydrogenase-like protein
MEPIGKHAIVLGASMAGLAAARVLADAYQRVTVLERDTLPGAAAHRKGATPTGCWPPAGWRWRSCSPA